MIKVGVKSKRAGQPIHVKARNPALNVLSCCCAHHLSGFIPNFLQVFFLLRYIFWLFNKGLNPSSWPFNSVVTVKRTNLSNSVGIADGVHQSHQPNRITRAAGIAKPVTASVFIDEAKSCFAIPLNRTRSETTGIFNH